MRHILKPSPGYAPGYQRIDTHGALQESILETVDYGDNDTYLGEDLPFQITLPLALEPIKISSTVTGTLSIINIMEYPAKPLYPNLQSYIAGMKLTSDGYGTYIQEGMLRAFKDYCIESAQIVTNNRTIYQKDFLIQEANIRQERKAMSRYEIFPYAGLYDAKGGIESIQQTYATLFVREQQTLIHVKTAKGWNEAGYTAPVAVSTMAQDIIDGKVTLKVKHSGIDFTYKSISYQEVDCSSSKIIIHFVKAT